MSSLRSKILIGKTALYHLNGTTMRVLESERADHKDSLDKLTSSQPKDVSTERGRQRGTLESRRCASILYRLETEFITENS